MRNRTGMPRSAHNGGTSPIRRAAILTPSTDPTAGGVERFSHLIAELLEEQDVSVEFAVPTEAPLSVRRFGGAFIHASISATRVACRPRPDLLVSNGYLGWPVAPCKRVHVFHGCMVEYLHRTDSGRVWYDRLRQTLGGGLSEALAGRRARTVAVSSSVATELRSRYRLEVDAVIPNGVDTSTFRPHDKRRARLDLGLDETAPLALFVGRWEHRKQPDVALAACQRSGFDLLVAGSGPVPRGPIPLGVLSPSELALAYAAADCVLAPSLYEACAFVPLEALAVGVPVITTGVGSIPDLVRAVPAYASLVVDPDAEAIAIQASAT